MGATIDQDAGEIQKTATAGAFTSLGLALTYHRWGPAEAPLVLLLHGFLDQGRSFDPVARALADRWQVVALDQRGHGASGHLGAGGYYHFTDYVLDVDALLRHLGVARAVVVGHSMGASVALYFAGAFPERVTGLALLDGVGPPAGAPADAPRLMRRWIEAVRQVEARRAGAVGAEAGGAAAASAGAGGAEAGGAEAPAGPPGRPLAELVARVRAMSPRAEEATLQALALAACEPCAGGYRWRHDALHRTPGPHYVDEARLRAFLAAVACPTLVLWGEHTPLKGRRADGRTEVLADASVGTVAGAGHNLHHEAPAATAAALRAWLEARGL